MKYRSLELRNLSFSYQEKPRKMEDYVFQNLSFSLPLETTVCFSGPVGAGKNTLLKILAALEEPLSGSFLVNGQDIFAEEEHDRFDFRRHMGYGFSQGGLLQNRSVRENLELALDFMTDFSEAETAERVDEYLARFELTQVQEERPSLISGGMRMAACLARAFIHHPELLLLSHPTNGLGQSAQENLLDLIAEHRKQKNLRHIFLISENESFLRQIDHLELNVYPDKLEAA